jgi:pimeloyl-ACP methyl ester carboxylesterase
MHDQTITLDDGRSVGVADYGEQGLPAIVYCHGAPTSRLDLVGVEAVLVDAGLRAVGIDRPGYGASTVHPGRSLASWTADAIAVADELNIERFAAVGVSSGGPYAVALAALHPDRVCAAAVAGAVTNMAWPQAWDGYLPIEVELMQLDDREVALARCVELIGVDGSGMGEHLGDMATADVELLADEAFAESFMASTAEAFRHGIEGYVDDLLAQGAPWPFDPGGIATPMFVHHGEDDTLVPVAHAEHTAAIVPGAELRVWPGHGHVSLFRELDTILAPLAAALR